MEHNEWDEKRDDELEKAVAGRHVIFDIDYPENLSRKKLLAKVFFGWLYVGVPHMIVLYLYQVAVTIVMFFTFWVILFTGKYPKGFFDFNLGYFRWSARVMAYLSMMRDEYPPFNGKE